MEREENLTYCKLHQIDLRLDHCRSGRCFKPKKLMLDKLNLSCEDIPLNDICGTDLGNSLHTLSIARNPLGSLPPQLVVSLPLLRKLDLSQCELHQLPPRFHLPKLTSLNMSHNRFADFPDESVFEGLPELQELNMYGNKISVIVVPLNPKLLTKLEILDLGYNNVSVLPDELDQLKSLKTLKVMNNLLSKVPMRICDMDLKSIDVSSNPVTEPPFETCERGISSMRRYWHCIRYEEQIKMKELETANDKAHQKIKQGKVGPMESNSAAGGLDVTNLGESSSLIFPKFVSLTPSRFLAMQSYPTLDRSSSDQSTGSLLYCKTPIIDASEPLHHNGGVSDVLGNSTLGESSSLIFPTFVDSGPVDDRGKTNSNATLFKLLQINLRLDKCESVRFFKPKKLMLDKLNLRCADVPLKDLCGTPLGNSLQMLSLAGNRMGAIPPELVLSLPVLRTLDLSQCELHQLPPHFNLPKLTLLNLSNNRFADFPDESVFEGLPELQELNMYGNKVSAIVVPLNPKLLSKLETLDLGYNNVSVLPDELDQLKSLKTLKVMNNLLSKVPMRICDMDLKSIDVSSNPVTEPPFETCERGICSMRRFWHILGKRNDTERHR